MAGDGGLLRPKVGADAALVANPPSGYFKFGADATGVYVKSAGTPGGTDGTVTRLGLTTEQLQDIIGAMFTDSSDLDFTYDDPSGTITATIKALAIVNTMLAIGAVTDDKASLHVKPSGGLVATTNLTLSGAQTIDGVAGTAGTTIVLATAQTTGSQNGPWIMQTGAWTRPSWYPSGGTTQAFQFITILIRIGTTYQGTTWRMTTSGAITIDTTATTWAITTMANAGLSAMPANTIKAEATGASATPQDLAIAANQFAARGSTGNLAAKTITDFGLSLVDDADAAAARATLGLGTAATQNSTAFDAAGAAAAAQAASQPLDGTLTALAGQNWAANAIPVGTGADTVTQLALPANTIPARSSTGNVAAKAITDYAISTLFGVASAAALTALIVAATTSLAGAMSPTDKQKLDNQYIDVTANSLVSAANQFVGDDSTDNAAKMAALYAATPLNSVWFYPTGRYRTSAELSQNRDIRLRQVGQGHIRSVIVTTSATAHIFHTTIDAYYNSWELLGFDSTVTRTGGTAILCDHQNAYSDVRRCGFTHQFNSISYSNSAGGGVSGNISVIEDNVFDTPYAGGAQITINAPVCNCVVTNNTINCVGVAGNGMVINQSGAVQVLGNDFIGGTDVFLINATGTVNSVFLTNNFLDQAGGGATFKISGTGAVARVKVLQCGITSGAAGLNAIELVNTGTGTAITDGIDIEDCDIYNNGFGGTTTGILATGWRGLGIKNNRISGFTNGVDLTPYNGNGISRFQIIGNVIGPTENFSGNTNGIQLRAGSFTYGSSILCDNDLSGNTTAPWVYAATVTAGDAIQVSGNAGLVCAQNQQPAQLFSTTAITRAGNAVSFPANAARPGTRVKLTYKGTNAATINTAPGFVPTARFGAANSSADTNILTPLTAAYTSAGTAVVGSATWELDFTILTATTAFVKIRYVNGNQAVSAFTGTGMSSHAFWEQIPTGVVTIPNISGNNFLAAYFTSTVANIVTMRAIDVEVWQ